MTDRIAVDKKKLFLVLLYSVSCTAMSHYTFDVAKVDQSIDEAEHVPAFLSIVREQLGIARFVAERTDFDSLDVYMNARYEANEFSGAYGVELFLKEYEVERGRGGAFIEWLLKNGLISRRCVNMAYLALYNNKERFYRFVWSQVPLINLQVCWIYHLTKFHQRVSRALNGTCLMAQVAHLLAAHSFLAKFSNDLGSQLTLDYKHLASQASIKASLHDNNRRLYGAVRLLCHNYEGSDNDEDAEYGCEIYGGLGAPKHLVDYQYRKLYYWHLRPKGWHLRYGNCQDQDFWRGECCADDHKRLVDDLEIYTRVYLAPENGCPIMHYWDD